MKLSKELKERITQKESSLKFKDQVDELNAKIGSILTDKINEQQKGIVFPDQLLNEGFITTSLTCNVYFEGERVHFNMDKAMPIRGRYYTHEIPPCTKLESLLGERKKLKAEVLQFEKKLERVLNGYSSSKKLLMDFPEFQRHFPQNGQPANQLVPIELINNVRKMLAPREISTLKQ